MFTLGFISAEVHLGFTKKDNYIMPVSATVGKIKIFIMKMSSQVPALLEQARNHVMLKVLCLLTFAHPISGACWKSCFQNKSVSCLVQHRRA